MGVVPPGSWLLPARNQDRAQTDQVGQGLREVRAAFRAKRQSMSEAPGLTGAADQKYRPHA